MRLAAVCAIGWMLAAAGDARAQRPTAVAEVRLDVNGDRRPDVIRIEEPAAISVSITGNRSASAWKPFTAPAGAGKLIGGELELGVGPRYPGGPVIVATARFGGRGVATTEEAIVLQWKRGRLDEVWRGAVGLRGPDREWSQHVATSPHGLIRYQGKPGVERCDGQPAYLFLEKYDWKQKRFRPVSGNLVRAPASAPRIQATRNAPVTTAPPEPQVFRRVTASSSETAASARDLAPPRELVDGALSTVWREGAPGHGRGELITFRSALGEAEVAALRIVPGDASTPQAFKSHNRLRSALVLTHDRAVWVDLPTDPAADIDQMAEPYWAMFDPPLRTRCVTVVIDGVYPVRSAGTTAIAELAPLTGAELSAEGLYPELAAAVAEGGAAADSAAKTLARGGEPAARALLDAAAEATGDDALLRLRLAMARLAHPLVVSELIAGLTADSGEQPTRTFSRGLIAIGAPAIVPTGALLADDKARRDARIAAAAILGALPDGAATAALLGATGAADKEVRRAVGIALARPESRLPALLAHVSSDAPARSRATAWRAVGTIARGLPDGEARAGATAALVKALVEATDYELRYRLFDAAGPLREPAVLTALAASVERLGAGPEGAALKRVAAGALANNPSPQAAALLASWLAAADPGVRQRAVRALGERDHAPSDQPIADLLAGDRWTIVRRAAAAALAPRCKRSVPEAALWTAVDRDPDLAVALSALAALVQCAPDGLVDRLLAMAGQRKRPPAIRTRSCGYLATVGDAAVAPKLVGVFEQARSEALSGGESALEVAAACAAALGGLGDPSVVPVLTSTARDNAFPELQAAAAGALGLLCPAEAKQLLAELRGSPQRRVSLAAKAAYDRCYR